MDIKRFLSGIGQEVVILLMFAGILFYVSAVNVAISFMPAISFEELLEDDSRLKPGAHVAGDVVYVLDYFASETTYHQYRNGTRDGYQKSGNYYLIPTSSKFIGLKSRGIDMSGLNQLSDETFAYLSDLDQEPVTKVFMQGRVKVMDEEIAEYFWEYLEDMGYTQEEIEAMGEPLLIEYVSFNGARLLFAIGVLLVLSAFGMLMKKYKSSGSSSFRRAEDLPYVPPQV